MTLISSGNLVWQKTYNDEWIYETAAVTSDESKIFALLPEATKVSVYEISPSDGSVTALVSSSSLKYTTASSQTFLDSSDNYYFTAQTQSATKGIMCKYTSGGSDLPCFYFLDVLEFNSITPFSATELYVGGYNAATDIFYMRRVSYATAGAPVWSKRLYNSQSGFRPLSRAKEYNGNVYQGVIINLKLFWVGLNGGDGSLIANTNVVNGLSNCHEVYQVEELNGILYMTYFCSFITHMSLFDTSTNTWTAHYARSSGGKFMERAIVSIC